MAKLVKLKLVVKMLRRSLLLGKKSGLHSNDEYEKIRDSSSDQVPEDVKEGHLAVVAADGDEPKRFIIPLSYLTHPTFLRLLEQAAEEYGFDREGALTIPCRPCELERILSEQWQEEDGQSSTVSVKWTSCNSTIQSC